MSDPIDRTEAHEIAELECRRYFERYLHNVFPKQMTALKHHNHLTVEAHDHDPKAHGGVERKVNKATWIILGAVVVGGGTFSALVGKLLSLV